MPLFSTDISVFWVKKLIYFYFFGGFFKKLFAIEKQGVGLLGFFGKIGKNLLTFGTKSVTRIHNYGKT
jgi:hypothetical protein